jgi:acetolactate synthase-1/2/3 large subunit
VRNQCWATPDAASDFATIARGFGIQASTVTKPGELKAALAAALASGVPYLLDVVVDPSF